MTAIKQDMMSAMKPRCRTTYEKTYRAGWKVSDTLCERWRGGGRNDQDGRACLHGEMCMVLKRDNCVWVQRRYLLSRTMERVSLGRGLIVYLYTDKQGSIEQHMHNNEALPNSSCSS